MHLVTLTREYLNEFLPNMSYADRFEVAVSMEDSVYSPEYLIKRDFDQASDGEEFVCVIHNKRPIVIGGYNLDGRCWFLMSTHAERVSASDSFWLASIILQMKAIALEYSGKKCLHNFMLANNHIHRKLLTKLGAKFGRPIKIQGYDFLPFTIE